MNIKIKNNIYKLNLFILFITLFVMNTSIRPELEIDSQGLDERFPEKENKRKEIHKILKNYEKIELLKKLQSNISIQDKLDIIEKNDYSSTYKSTNMKGGGLLNEWDFDFS